MREYSESELREFDNDELLHVLWESGDSHGYHRTFASGHLRSSGKGMAQAKEIERLVRKEVSRRLALVPAT